MDPQTLVIVLRMLERIVGVFIGGLLIYFAYRLFLNLPGKAGIGAGSGEFSIAGGNKIKLSKVGPGVFFALFGTGLIAFSLTRSVSFTTSTSPAPPTAAGAATATGHVASNTFIGATLVPETDEDRIGGRIAAQRNIAALNQAVERASAADRVELERAVAKAKLALMEPLWAEDWGDPADFREWIQKGGAPPATVQAAAEVYQQR